MFYFLNGLNFLPFASSPHYNKPERKSFDDALAGEKLKGYAVEDQVALIFEDGKTGWQLEVLWLHGSSRLFAQLR
jgi:peptidase E